MKKTISTILVVVMAFTMSIGAFAATDSDYRTVYAQYKDLYLNTYVTAYHAYNATLDEFADKVAMADITTKEQFTKIADFVAYLKQTKADFFGDRTTPDKSRYVVPALRSSMEQAYYAKDYDTAIDYCNQLMDAIRARINFFEQMSKQIADFDITGTGSVTTSTATIRFVADDVWSTYSFGGKIYITNNTNEPINDWELSFKLNGVTLNSVWGFEGGAVNMRKSGDAINLKPLNKHQEIYTIPANGTIVLGINCNGDATQGSISGSVFNSEETTISYTVK